MNKCVHYVKSFRYRDIMAVCGHAAPFMVNGSSFCEHHVKAALAGTTCGYVSPPREVPDCIGLPQ